MKKESNNIFLADALVYLAKSMHKKYSTTFVWQHPFSTYLSYDRFFKRLSLYASVHILDDQAPLPSPFPKLRTYLMDGLFLNQKTNKNIRKSFSLNTNIRSNIKFFSKKINDIHNKLTRICILSGRILACQAGPLYFEIKN